MKICIVGGSGFIGTYLMDLLQQDYELQNIDKQPSAQHADKTSIADICNYEALLRHMQPCDWVILLAAEHRDDVQPTSRYYDVNVAGTRNVLQAMQERGIKKILFASSVSVYGLNKGIPDETFPAQPFNHYGKSKWQAEEVLRTWQAATPGSTLLIIRPTVVFGPRNRGNVYNLLRQVVAGSFVMAGNGNNKKSMAFIENVAHFIRYLLQHNSQSYHVFNYADKPDLSMNELLKITGSILHKKTTTIRIPYWLAYAGGLLFDMAGRLTGKQFTVSGVRVKKFCASTQFSASKAEATGFKPPCTLQQGLVVTILSIKEELK